MIKLGRMLGLCVLAAAPMFGAFTYDRTMTIDHTKCGSSDSSNFATLVSISAQTYIKTVGNGGHVQNSSGFDIGFYSDSGLTTKLNWEVEFYDGSAGTLVAWVKTTCNHTSDNVFYMAYGDSGISSFQGNVASTWDANFEAVWHLKDGTTLSMADSSSSGYTLTNSGNPAPAVTGKVDGGASTGSLQYLTAPTMTAPSLVTWSIWIKTSSTGNFQEFMTAVNANYYLLRLDTSNHIDMLWNYNTSTIGEITGSTNLADGVWHQVTGTYDGTNIRLYVDGSQVGTAQAASFTNPFTSLVIGGRQGDTSALYFIGSVDEVRFSKSVRSADWVTAEWNNQNNPGTFITIGTEGSPSGGTLFTKTTTELLTLLDLPADSVGRVKSVSEILIIKESGVGIVGRVKSTTELLAVIDSRTGFAAHFAVPFDVSLVSDSRSGLGTHFGTANDLLAVLDTRNGLGAHFGTTSDRFYVIDSDTGYAAHIGSGNDYLATKDSSLGLGTHFASKSESLATVDISAGLAAHFGIGTERIPASDSPSDSAGRVRSATDILALLEIQAQRNGKGVVVSELLSVRDFPTGLGAHFASPYDLIAALDGRAGIGSHFGSAQETFTLIDRQSTVNGKAAIFSETIGIRESSLGFGAHIAGVTESMAALDVASKAAAFLRSQFDQLSLSNTQARLAGFVRSIADATYSFAATGGLGAHFSFPAEILSALNASVGVRTGAGGGPTFAASVLETLRQNQAPLATIGPWAPFIDHENLGVYVVKTKNGIYIKKITIGVVK